MSLSETLYAAFNLLTNPAFTAVLSAALTGAVVQWIATRGQSKDKDKVIKVDESTALRIELRAEIDKLRKQLDDKEIALDKWRNDYYALIDKYNDAMNRARIAEADLREAREEIEKLKPPSGSS